MLDEITDWNDRPLQIARSRGGVPAVLSAQHGLLWDQEAGWPPAALRRKLKASRQINAFDDQAKIALKACDGVYSDLQSLRSEDAITWSFFGTVGAAAVELLNWLVVHCKVEGEPSTTCEIAMWRRLPHPDTGVAAHGPEPDFALLGDTCLILGEAKWGAKEDVSQGVLGDASQMDMRRGSLVTLNEALGGGRRLVALGVVQSQTLEPPPPDSSAVSTRIIEWSDLTAFTQHPMAEEFSRYLAWKARVGEPSSHVRRSNSSW